MTGERRIRVYIAGPMSNGGAGYDLERINDAIRVHLRLINDGFVPHCPQLTMFCELMFPGTVSYTEWMALDRNYIDDCDIVLRLPGESKGADNEVQYAQSRSKTVYYSLYELQDAHKEAFVCSGM